MYKYLLFVILVNFVFECSDCKEFVAFSWINFVRDIRHSFKDCLAADAERKSSWKCIKEAFMEKLEEAMSSEVIPLINGIRLIRFSANGTCNDHTNERFDLVERVAKRNLRTWPNRILDIFERSLSTHVLQIDGKELITETGKGRLRRRHQMLPMMVFGMTALGMVLVPIGFQFLAVLGGKALLMAKMALLLASINGLKRIATSGLNYGLYQVPPDPYNYYDRGDPQRPRKT